MTGGIFLIQNDGNLVEMNEQPYDSESLLQELIAKYPNLLAGDGQSTIARKWLLIRREMGVPGELDGADRWSLDHLFLDQDAVPTLVEVKRSSDTRIRREVVGQMLDYAANGVVYWPVEEFRSHFERQCEIEGINADARLREVLGPERDPEEFWQQAKTNLRAGRIRMVFVADAIPPELRRIVEFLNAQMKSAEVLAIEMRQFVGQGLRSLVPRIIGQTAEADATKGVSNRSVRVWDEEAFFNGITKDYPVLVELHRDLLARIRNIGGLSPRFGSKASEPMYTVLHDAAGRNVIWVYGNGGLYVVWGGIRKSLGEDCAEAYRQLWRDLAPIDDPKGNPKSGGAMVTGGIETVAPAIVADRLAAVVQLKL